MVPGQATVGNVNVPDLVETDDEGECDAPVNNSVDAAVDSSSDNCNISDSATEAPPETPSPPSEQTAKPPPHHQTATKPLANH